MDPHIFRIPKSYFESMYEGSYCTTSSSIYRPFAGLRKGVARFDKCARELYIKDGSKEHNLTERWTDPSVKKHVKQTATAFQSMRINED